MLTLFHAPRSRSSRIVWLLEELGADCAIRYVTIRYQDGRGGDPDAANRHPDKKVPALDHDGTVISESTAVALYLCELHPETGLAPAPGARTVARSSPGCAGPRPNSGPLSSRG